MLTVRRGNTIAHRLDPRSKLAVQVGFAIAAFAHTTPRGLLALSGIAVGCLAVAGTSPIAAIRDLRVVLVLLLVAPLLEGAQLGAPWFVVGDAVAPALASYRVLLILLVSVAYVRSTPVRDSRAALQRTVPGRAGQLLGVGVAAVFRFVPVLLADLLRIRDAMNARLGSERPLRRRMQVVAVAGLNRAYGRADRLAIALRVRCFAWNPTLPVLSFGPNDYPALALAAALALWGIWPGTLSALVP